MIESFKFGKTLAADGLEVEQLHSPISNLHIFGIIDDNLKIIYLKGAVFTFRKNMLTSS